jgi:hypothetical protein
MQYRFAHWPLFFTTVTVDTHESGLTVHIKSLRNEATYRYEYTDLKPFVVQGRTTDDSYANIGWGLLAIALAALLLGKLSFADLVTASVPSIIFLVSFFGAVVAFSTQLIKYNCAWFMTKLDTTAFGISYPPSKRDDAIAFIEEFERNAAIQNKHEAQPPK